MNDLIDRDKTIKQFCKQDCGCDPKDCPDKTCYEVEIIESVPTHPTPSNTLGALDCIDRQEAIKALCREECGMYPKGCYVGTCYDVEIIEDVPSVQLELSNNSPELDNKNRELISRQKAIDAISKKQGGVFDQDAEIDTAVLYVYSECKAIIKDLPSVQPDVPDTNVGELISRQAAIELAMKYCPDDDGAVQCDGDIRGLLDELENQLSPGLKNVLNRIRNAEVRFIENEIH